VVEQTAFLFDMDGTLADTMPFHLQAWMELLGQFGIRMAPQEFLRKTSGKMNHQILREVLGLALCDADLARFEARKESHSGALPRSSGDRGLPTLGGRRLNVSLAVATGGKGNREFVLQGLDRIRFGIGRGRRRPKKRTQNLPETAVRFNRSVSLRGLRRRSGSRPGRAGMKAVATTSPDAQNRHPARFIAKDYTLLRPQALVEAVKPSVDRTSLPSPEAVDPPGAESRFKHASAGQSDARREHAIQRQFRDAASKRPRPIRRPDPRRRSVEGSGQVAGSN
jgi:hypothetical protein